MLQQTFSYSIYKKRLMSVIVKWKVSLGPNPVNRESATENERVHHDTIWGQHPATWIIDLAISTQQLTKQDTTAPTEKALILRLKTSCHKWQHLTFFWLTNIMMGGSMPPFNISNSFFLWRKRKKIQQSFLSREVTVVGNATLGALQRNCGLACACFMNLLQTICAYSMTQFDMESEHN